MGKLLRWVGYGIGGLAALALVAVLAIYFLSARILGERPTPQSSNLAQPTAAQLADGPHQLRVLGCLSCHGANLQGDVVFDEPGVATVYAPNLTLVAAKATDQQLDQAIRQGISDEGEALVIMPSQQYQFLTDQEVAALIATIRAMPKRGREQPAVNVGFKGRIGLVLAKFRTAPGLVREYRASPLADFGPQFARGRHIIETNCTECHGPNLVWFLPTSRSRARTISANSSA
jgi:mono/diheme cytochrome c family protein